MTTVCRYCDQGSAKLRRQAERLGDSLTQPGSPPARTSTQDGYLMRAVRTAGRQVVSFVDLPGRFVFGSGTSDVLINNDGQQVRGNYGMGIRPVDIGLLGRFPAPVRREMEPTGEPVTLPDGEAEPFALRRYYRLGAALPDQILYCLIAEDPGSHPGGLVFPYVLSERPGGVNADYELQKANKWMLLADCPTGSRPARHLVVSEAYLQALSGYGFIGRTDAPNFTGRAAGALSLSANRIGERLVVSISVAKGFPNGDGSQYLANCAILTLAFDFSDEDVSLAWWNLFEPWTVGNPAFTLKTYIPPGDTVPIQLGTGAHVPCLAAWVDRSGPVPVERVVVTGAVRSERSVEVNPDDKSGEGVPDIVGSFRVDITDGAIISSQITDVDAVCTPQSNALAYAPQADPARIYVPSGRERLFVIDGELIRIRSRMVWTRTDNTPYPLDSQLTQLIIERRAGVIRQTADQFGADCNLHRIPSTATTYRGSVDAFTPLQAILVSSDEVWLRTFVGTTLSAGVARAPLASGITRYDGLLVTPYFQLSVYQREILQDGVLRYPLGVVLSAYEASTKASRIAIVKGRDADVVWQDAPGYGDTGTHYLNNPFAQITNGRQFA